MTRCPPPHPGRRGLQNLLLLGFVFGSFLACAQPTNQPPTHLTSIVLEAAGLVEFSRAASTNWQAASVGLALRPGDRLRTRDQSRAALQLSDRSVIRLNERTTLEILPPRRAEKKRFGLPVGSIYFFNREKPADIEFDTPLAAGAIRGTEFLLAVGDAQNEMRLALIDGAVSLQTAGQEIRLERGEQLQLAAGQAPRRTALLNVNTLIQWALYYPAVVNPEDIQLDSNERVALSNVLEHYAAGDLLAALAGWPADATLTGPAARTLNAQLLLSVGAVAEAERLIDGIPRDTPGPAALLEMIAVVRGNWNSTNAPPPASESSSELLAHSYALQARTALSAAHKLARQAVTLAPRWGAARARLAELEYDLGRLGTALQELKQAQELSPRFAPAFALQGFVLFEQGSMKPAEAQFDRARELDAALGVAWLGRGLVLLQNHRFEAARASFQTAAALEPQRSLFRSYLGKVNGQLGLSKEADKEFRLAQKLDPKDPTPWLYSALARNQDNMLNEAVRDLEQSIALNDNRAVFRSRLLLDNDRAVRSADLAAVYEDAGLADVSRHTAANAVAADYANFSGHLFLANSYQTLETANRFDLRLETARQSELLVANLLAPPGGGNLSQLLSQQEHLQFFDLRPIGVSSLTQYGSDGDWRQSGTVFGAVDGFSYAFDAFYQSLAGQQPNGQSEVTQFTLTTKQRVTSADEAYFQIGRYNASAGDLAQYYEPSNSVRGFHVDEKQEPTLYVGWHHTWAPGSHTLFLFGRLEDNLSLTNPQPNVLFLAQRNGDTFGVQTGFFPPFRLDYASDFTLYSGELQQIWETERQSLVVGGRWQSGHVDNHATLQQDQIALGFLVYSNRQAITGDLQRGNAYGYYTVRPFEQLQLIGGVSYDHLEFPENTDLPPLSATETTRNLVSPKAGLILDPWNGGRLRGIYTKSLGGLFFDNSVRLEPTQVAGFNQAFRNLIPGSVAGLVPGTEFETAGVGFDQSTPWGTFLGIETELLKSQGRRVVGALTNSTFLPIPDAPSSTEETLDFRERNLSAYLSQLIGDNFSVGARYRITEARLEDRFPAIPDTAIGLNQLEKQNEATLHELALGAGFYHPCGVFAQWESTWYHQDNSGYTPSLAGDDFWQHNFSVGYRFPRRRAEVRFSVLNITDQDYRLNPLNFHADLPRGRMFVTSLRLNF